MNLILVVWLLLCSLFLGIPSVYHVYLKRAARRPWKLRNDDNYLPSVTILVPTYNESNMISHKLGNLHKLKYPKDLLHVIIVDSASTDKTLENVFTFAKAHSEMNVSVLREQSRSGKSKALNLALPYATGDVVIVSDADSFLPENILMRSLPVFSDPSVGAFGGRELFLNMKESWITLGEESYLKLMDTIKLGESKIQSTIFFEGGFSAYKKEYLDEFDCKTGSDDCGTALNIVQKGVRAVFVPEATFYTVFPGTLKGKLSIKVRRANQLVRIWMKCLNLLLRRKLLLPKKVAVFEIFLFLINPILFALLLFTTFALILQYLPHSLFFLLAFSITLLAPRIRFLFLNGTLSYIILLVTLVALAFGKKFTVWEIPGERKKLLTCEMLEKMGLV